MKTNHIQRSLFISALLVAQAVAAQDQSTPLVEKWDPFAPSTPQTAPRASQTAPAVTQTESGQAASSARPLQLDPPAESPSRNRIVGSLRFGLNISGKFSGIGGGFNPYGPGYPNTTPDGNRYNYGDGYVNTDISGNAGGQTWNWGYDNVGQVNIGSSTVSMDNTVGGSGTSGSQDIDNSPGFEFTYDREFGIVKDLHNMHWGVEAAANYLPVSYSVSGTFNASMVSTPYFLAGGTPPGYSDPSELPYQGSFGNPGFVIGSTPSGPSTTTPLSGSVSVNDSYNGDLWGFRLGPYVEWPLGERFSLHLSGGLALGIIDGSANWNETLTLPSGVQNISGSGSDTSLLVGGYVSGAVDYRFAERWDVEASVQFQDLGTYNHDFGGRSVNLDLSESVFVLVGVSYHF